LGISDKNKLIALSAFSAIMAARRAQEYHLRQQQKNNTQKMTQ
jgi:hypothetical protein